MRKRNYKSLAKETLETLPETALRTTKIKALSDAGLTAFEIAAALKIWTKVVREVLVK